MQLLINADYLRQEEWAAGPQPFAYWNISFRIKSLMRKGLPQSGHKSLGFRGNAKEVVAIYPP